MGEKATFHIADDWVALLELKPAARTVYGILRSNAAFGRSGVATHTVHVTSSWFTEMTQHWESPLTAPTVRRGLNELIEKGVLRRLNDPHDGSGFVLAFVTDPGPNYNGPINGFRHAKEVAKRCGTRAYYVRRDEIPGSPDVTGVRRGKGEKRKSPDFAPRQSLDFDERGLGEPDLGEPDFHDEAVHEVDVVAEVEKEVLDPAVEALAEALQRKTSRLTTPGHRLTPDQCRKVAVECGPVLALGWDPAMLAQRMVSQMGPKIHSPLLFLPKKAVELGTPPQPQRSAVKVPRVVPQQSQPAMLTPEEAASGAAGPGMQKLQQFLEEQRHRKGGSQNG
ncbi:hypothetical protein ACFW2V_12395 [Streptomyces sp. NPDC058947]|uniref:hypothetical protein n=1 Tax=Streptomyces sp. NPDC058947 TaxID=3346675 RepID=UPI00368486ED